MLCDYIVDFLRCGDGIGDSPVLRGGSVVKNPPASAGDTGDMGSIPGLGRSPKEGNGNPLQYSFLRNPMNRGAWRAIVCGVMSQIRLSNCVHARTHTHTHTR